MTTAPHATGQQPPSPAAPPPGKYLTFTLAGEIYGVPVLAVREIIRLCPITAVAGMPPHVRGVVNLRGKIIPLVDLRIRFGLPVADAHDRTCIVVAQLALPGSGSRLLGLVVDGVEEVASFAAADGLIVGSSVKQRGDWRMPLDPDAVRRLADAFASADSVAKGRGR
jgi:purine-binding chemotaxis protein CheW